MMTLSVHVSSACIIVLHVFFTSLDGIYMYEHKNVDGIAHVSDVLRAIGCLDEIKASCASVIHAHTHTVSMAIRVERFFSISVKFIAA